MTQEEKFEEAKRLYETANADQKYVLESLFPELKESEDERIRKELLNAFQESEDSLYMVLTPHRRESFIAWLEKQGEQNPIKVPKFKAGDWVVCNNGSHPIFQVIERSWPDAKYRNIKGAEIFLNVKTLEKQYHLWTIQDAKDGDVLACENGWTCIFKTLVNDETFSSYCFMDDTKWFCETGSECHTLKEEFAKACNGEIHPATKEQRDTLMKAMADAGYTFDFEKKELKKIEQKPDWSEEDEKAINDIMWIIEAYRENGFNETHIQMADSSEKWLKSLKDRVLPQPKREWSDVDKDILFRIIDNLKFLRDDISKDSKYAVNIIDIEREIAWLKSLRPQNRWKPSDEQMRVLDLAIRCGINRGTTEETTLVSLFNDLKKLTE